MWGFSRTVSFFPILFRARGVRFASGIPRTSMYIRTGSILLCSIPEAFFYSRVIGTCMSCDLRLSQRALITRTEYGVYAYIGE